MSVQQPANLAPYPNMWQWSYQCAQSQMTAQAMNASAMGLHAPPGAAPALNLDTPLRSMDLSCESFRSHTATV